MKTFKEKAKIIMLSSDKPVKNNQVFKSPIVGDTLMLAVEDEFKYTPERIQPQHLYIVDDSEICKGDWVYSKEYGIGKIVKDNQQNYKGDFPLRAEFIDKPNYSVPYNTDGSYTSDRKKIYLKDCKKIIATTDSSLREHDDTVPYPKTRRALPSIPQEFIEEYVKAYNSDTPITRVLVEYNCLVSTSMVTLDLSAGKVNEKSRTPKKCVESKLSLTKDNEIIIHSAKEKWSREEVVKILKFFNKDNLYTPHDLTDTDVEDWVKENL